MEDDRWYHTTIICWHVELAKEGDQSILLSMSVSFSSSTRESLTQQQAEDKRHSPYRLGRLAYGPQCVHHTVQIIYHAPQTAPFREIIEGSERDRRSALLLLVRVARPRPGTKAALL